MGKGTHFFGQPVYGQLIKSLDRDKIVEMSREMGGESANAIKIQIWVTLIANLLMTLLQSRLTRHWSFSGLATMVRIVLMYYINLNTFFEKPEEDLKMLLMEAAEAPPGEDKS